MKYFFILAFLIFGQLISQSQFSEDIISSKAPVRKVITSSSSEFRINYTFAGFTHALVECSDKQRLLLQIKDFTYTKEAGKPAIPTHSDLVALKRDGSYEIQVERNDSIIFQDIDLAPARKPARDTYGAPEPAFITDSIFY
ncbi:MAG: hypothetical protein U5L09_05405 [Bacteroidales bacterium]|nr:hypothetical protein [Bacteroidales bacterium]